MATKSTTTAHRRAPTLAAAVLTLIRQHPGIDRDGIVHALHQRKGVLRHADKRDVDRALKSLGGAVRRIDTPPNENAGNPCYALAKPGGAPEPTTAAPELPPGNDNDPQPFLDLANPAAVRAWLDDLEAAVVDLADVAEDASEAPGKRRMGRAEHRRASVKARGSLRRLLAFAGVGVAVAVARTGASR